MSISVEHIYTGELKLQAYTDESGVKHLRKSIPKPSGYYEHMFDYDWSDYEREKDE